MKRTWAVLVAVLLLVAPAASAQKKSASTTRSVLGVVTDNDDSPVAGAVVQLSNTKTPEIRSFISLKDGSYRFYELNPDVDYKIKADFQGATSGSKTLSSFDSRKEAVINLKLGPKK